VVGHDECGLCRVWTSGEREGAGKYKGENLLLHLPMRVQGKKKTHIAIKNDIVLAFFFYEQYMKRRWFEQNTLFLLKENGAKKVNFQISHQFVIYSIKSSIVIFILRIISIAFLLNSNVSPDVGCLFHFGP
jgi:ATP-dependent Zn protease